ncbi:MAG: CGNR zinc finger domain-containing protein [Asticcacaulis sp.]
MDQDIRDGFVFRGGHVALDLTATLAPVPEAKDALAAPRDLLRWLKAAGMDSDEVSADNLSLAREVRDHIRRLATARVEGTVMADRDRERLNSLAREGAAPELTAEGRVRWRGSTRALLSSIAAEAVWLLGNDPASRIRLCQGEGCHILFHDTSRAGERRWCSMLACGNRAKAAEFRKRKGKV